MNLSKYFENHICIGFFSINRLARDGDRIYPDHGCGLYLHKLGAGYDVTN